MFRFVCTPFLLHDNLRFCPLKFKFTLRMKHAIQKEYCCLHCVFIYLFFGCVGSFLCVCVLDLCCCTQAFSSCGERGLLFVVVRGLLIVVASPAAELGL